jgi:hypothetical protein
VFERTLDGSAALRNQREAGRRGQLHTQRSVPNSATVTLPFGAGDGGSDGAGMGLVLVCDGSCDGECVVHTPLTKSDRESHYREQAGHGVAL